MKRMAIAELVPDMVLAKIVTNQNGLPIMAAGVTLDAPTIERLQRLGVSAVYVVTDTQGPGGKTLPELETELDQRFRRVADDPMQQMIHRTIRTYLRQTHDATAASGGPPTP